MADVSRRRRRLKTTRIDVMALDGIVNVNSLFTVAVFLGLTLKPSDTDTLVDAHGGATACVAGADIAQRLVCFHVYSFSCFLFSSLIASGIKQAIRVSRVAGGDGEGNSDGGGEEILRSAPVAHINSALLRFGTLASAVGSVSGCVFLILALVDLIQIKLGKLVCRSWYSFAAVAPLVTLVPSALVVYVCVVIYAFTR